MIKVLALLSVAALPPLTQSQLESIGKRVWQSEAAGKVEGLVDWNTGEAFASLGIGHFIWYPAGPKGPFEESFPSIVQYLTDKGAPPPSWLKPSSVCPWPNREAFIRDSDSERVRSLRKWLADTVPQQSQFLAERLERALPKMLDSVPKEKRAHVRQTFENLAAAPKGRFALIDYVNFKGEGTKLEERYAGQGWGLLQVLEETSNEASPASFSKAAEKVLRNRVKNAPPERHEERWLPGWLNRVGAYADR